MGECIFCSIIEGKIPSTLVYQDEDIIAFDDINPQAPVHTLIIPRQHIETINDLTSEQSSLVARMILVAKDVAKQKGISEEGYRLVWNCKELAGQSVFHIHLHLLGGRAMHWPPG